LKVSNRLAICGVNNPLVSFNEELKARGRHRGVGVVSVKYPLMRN